MAKLAYHTFQIAIKNNGAWTREYVCARDRMDAISVYLEENPSVTLDDIVALAMTAEVFEVEACA